MSTSKSLDQNKIVFYCDGCFRDISTMIFVSCDECEIDLCLKCYKEKVETQIHKACHRFRVVSNLEQELKDGWTVLESLLFINGLITYGIGNFADIAAIIPNKKEHEIKKKFFELTGITDNTEGETYVQQQNVNKSDPNDSEVISYMSQRREFDSEIINEYEALIQGIVDDIYDSETDKILKEQMLKYTRSVLKQRVVWKNFVIDRNILDVTDLRKKEKEEFGSFVMKFKWLLQFLSKKDFNNFLGGLYREKKLQDKIATFTQANMISVKELENVEPLFSNEEKKLCRKLNMSYMLYAKLKRLALECFLSKEPLKNRLFDLFEDIDNGRVEILYNWFCKNQIVVE
ncbi:general transcriptional adaptator [Nucleospora cyclopteri]